MEAQSRAAAQDITRARAKDSIQKLLLSREGNRDKDGDAPSAPSRLPTLEQAQDPAHDAPVPIDGVPASVVPPGLTSARKLLSTADHAFRTLMRDRFARAQACHRAGRPRGEAAAAYSVGVLWENLGDAEAAGSWYRRALTSAVEGGDREMCGVVHNALGVSMSGIAGKELGAIWHYKQQLELADGAGKAVSWTNIGLLLQRLTRYDEACVALREAAAFALRFCGVSLQIVTALNLGLCALTEVVQLYDAKGGSLPSIEQKECLCARASALTCLGEIYFSNGDHVQAIDLLEAAIETSEKTGKSELVTRARVALGICQGEYRAVETPFTWNV
jgi:tetratricopeptide (TPR) repeat protein